MMRNKQKNGTVTIATRITKPMYDAILNLLQSNAHVNIADYLRDLVREDLQHRNILEINQSKEGETT